MLLRAKGKLHPRVQAVSDEYEDEDRWQEQVKYWSPHKLTRRHTLVDVTHIKIVEGEIFPAGSKIYTFPREQVSPLTEYETNVVLGKNNGIA